MLPISRGIYNCLTQLTRSVQRQSTKFHTISALQCKENTNKAATEAEEDNENQLNAKNTDNVRAVVPVETSIRYLKSAAYKQTYGEDNVWTQYRRNHKGMYAPRKTRKTCIRQGKISTGNPCPICRDEYLVLDHRNTELLHQFISPQSGEVLSYSKTGLCQKSHFQLLVAVERARDYGLLTYDVPFREYDYCEYSNKEQQPKEKPSKP